jgi:probable selenium-dependent hydroxylase accessory protein YqeC
VTGAQPGEPLTPAHVARLLTSEHGALQGVGSATVVPIINMVDDEAKRGSARAAARQALAGSNRLARVVLASMTATDPLIEVLTP